LILEEFTDAVKLLLVIYFYVGGGGGGDDGQTIKGAATPGYESC
jgi:hypothetical protein